MGSIPKDKLPAGWLSPELGALLSIPVLDSLPVNPVKYTAPYVLIEAEVPARGHNLQDFHGCEIAKDLRVKHGYLGPIILVSCLPKEHFLDQVKSRNEYRILLGRGTGFLDLHDIGNPERISAIVEGITPLTSATLADLNTSLLSLYGYLRSRIGHDLRWDQPLTERTAIVDEVRGQLTPKEASTLFTTDRLSVLLHAHPNATDFGAATNDIANKIKELDPDQGQRSEERTWRPKVILLEDDAGLRKEYAKRLAKPFVIKATADALEAAKWIDEDEKNEIYGLLSDWRLYEDPSALPERRQWQALQGYEVLSHAASKRHIALFALTSLSEHHVHEIRNQLGVDIWLQKKEHLNSESAWNGFADLLHDACDRKLDIVCNQPTALGWSAYKGMAGVDAVKNKGGRPRKDGKPSGSTSENHPIRSFKDRYREQRNASAWSGWEDELSRDADLLWQMHYRPILDKSWDEMPLHPYTSGKIAGVKLDSVSLDLRDLLLYRRIYLALWCQRHVGVLPATRYGADKSMNPSWDITCVLSGLTPEERQDKPNWEGTLNRDAKALAERACIKREDLQRRKGILPEERAWLTRGGFELPLADDDTVVPSAQEEAEQHKEQRDTGGKSARSTKSKKASMNDGPSLEDIANADEWIKRKGLS